jgi:CPA1 family monovalent cation:H+ antiporter
VLGTLKFSKLIISAENIYYIIMHMLPEAHHATNQLNLNTIVVLMIIASIVAVIVKRIKIPYTIALVVVGLFIGSVKGLEPVELTEHLVLFIFLPALLFEAAFNLDLRHVKKVYPGVLILATLGVAVSIAIIGAGLHFILGMPWLLSLIFGAIVAPTDPVSVVAIMKRLHLDHTISGIVEGESLVNDGTSVVFFKLLLAMTMSFGLDVSPEVVQSYTLAGLGQFILVVLGGASLGALIGLAFSVITKFFDDHLLELTFTTITAYGTFLLAESISVPGLIPNLHLSGVIATVAAGLLMGNYGRHTGMSASTRIVVSSFWEYAAFFMNSLIFLLIGLEINLELLVNNWIPIAVAIGAMLFARIVSIYLLSGVINGFKITKLKLAWQHVLVVAALRGALSMALVLSLPKDIISEETRQLIIVMVFGVVLFTLIVQGLSISKFLEWFGLKNIITPDINDYQKLKARLRAAKASLIELHKLEQEGEVLVPVSKQISTELNQEIEQVNEQMSTLNITSEMLVTEDLIETKTQLLENQIAVVEKIKTNGSLSENAANELKARYDEELLKLKNSHH